MKSLRLAGSILCRAELAAPWSVHTRGLDGGIFHAVVRGGCWIIPDENPAGKVRLEAGDVVVLPGGDAHVMCDSPSTLPVPITSLPQTKSPGGSVPMLELRGKGSQTSLLCGRFDFERSNIHPMLSELPTVLHLRGADEEIADWLPATLQLMLNELESGRPGAELVTTRLADVLVTRAVRAVLERDPEDRGPELRGWLRGLTDPHVGKALGLVHREPCRSWTAASLAASVGLSRSSLFQRFTNLVGEPPTRYITRWRMHLASRALQDETLSLAQVAEQVGYTSESAFSKAFKRITGTTPGAYRRSQALVAVG